MENPINATTRFPVSPIQMQRALANAGHSEHKVYTIQKALVWTSLNVVVATVSSLWGSPL